MVCYIKFFDFYDYIYKNLVNINKKKKLEIEVFVLKVIYCEYINVCLYMCG